MQRYFSIGERYGNPMQIPGATATPRSFAVALRLGPVAWAWNTPVGMEIIHADGRSEHVKIIDVTRWALIGLGVFAAMTAARIARK